MTTALTTRDETPTTTSRDEAILRFGVTYLHGGAATSPIVESLGRHAFDPDPAQGRRAFASEADATAHVRDVMRRDLEGGLSRLEALDVGRASPFRLWLARNWIFWRSKEVGLLASEAISSEARRRVRDAEASFVPSVERLPPWLRLPATLELDTRVYVVDIRDFPDAGIEVSSDTVARRTVVCVTGHPAFDAVLRYELASGTGGFSYDTTDPSARRLGHPDENVRGFLDEDSAVREMTRLADNLRRAMEYDVVAKGSTVALPAPLAVEPPPPVSLPSSPADEPPLAIAPSPAGVRCPVPPVGRPVDWGPCRHVQAFLDDGTRVVRPSGVPEAESLSARFMAWAGERGRRDPATPEG